MATFTGLALAACVMAQQTGLEPAGASPYVVHEVPLELSDYPLVFVQVQVNGKPVRALVDSGGSSPIRLSSRLAQGLKLELFPDAKASVRGLDGRPLPVARGTLATFALGDALEHGVDIEVVGERVESISAQTGTAFDVILGWGFLSRYHFALDYRKRLLQFSASPLPLPASQSRVLTVPYSIVNRLPVIAARVAGQDVKLLLDTGAPMCNIDAQFAQTAVGNIVSRELLLDGRPLAVEWRAKDLSATRNALGTMGTLGNNLLRQYTVRVDTRRQMLTLE